MSKGQIIFAIITAVIAASGLGWTIFSWLRGRKPDGPMISVQLATGEIYDQQDQLIANFPNGNRRNMHVDKIQPTNEKPSRRKKDAPNPRDISKQPVSVVFVQNRGKTAVSIRRCEYLTPILQFEPQRAASRWGDVLPKRLEPGDEAIFIHERTEMRVFLNGVMRDHGVAQMLMLPVVTLGSGHEVSANIPLVIKADMTDDEFTAVKNFDKEVREEPPNEFLDVPKRRRLPWQRKPKKTLIARNCFH